MDLVVRFTAQAQLSARIPQVGNRLPDFGEEALPRKGQGAFSGVTGNPLSYSKDTLLLAVANKNPSGTDWEYTCLSPIPQVSVARYPSAAQKKDGAGV